MSNPCVRIGLLGSHGRMGKHVTRLLQGEYSDRATLIAEGTRGADPEALLRADTVIDFSSPAAIAALAERALGHTRTHWPAFIVGSTGFSAAELKSLEQLAQHTPVLVASNFSTGIQILQHALESVAPLLKKAGYTPVLTEKHHQYKKDAPSGTALTLARVLEPHHPQGIQTHSVRAGEIIGEHSVQFFGPADSLNFEHIASDRSIFARGALDVALWLDQKRRTLTAPPRALWSMREFVADSLL